LALQQKFFIYLTFPPVMNSRLFILCTTLGSLLLAPLAHAQYEIRGGASNLLDARRAGGSAAVASGQVSAITVRGGGAGYVSPPSVTVSLLQFVRDLELAR